MGMRGNCGPPRLIRPCSVVRWISFASMGAELTPVHTKSLARDPQHWEEEGDDRRPFARSQRPRERVHPPPHGQES